MSVIFRRNGETKHFLTQLDPFLGSSTPAKHLLSISSPSFPPDRIEEVIIIIIAPERREECL